MAESGQVAHPIEFKGYLLIIVVAIMHYSVTRLRAQSRPPRSWSLVLLSNRNLLSSC